MWIQDKYGTAINSRHIITIRCDSEVKPFRVDAWLCDYEGDADNCYYLNEFETRAEAKEYINRMVTHLNFAEGKLKLSLTQEEFDKCERTPYSPPIANKFEAEGGDLMNKMLIALKQIPRTNAETKALALLDDVAEIASLYHRLSGFYGVGTNNTLPPEIQATLKEANALIKLFEKKIGKELILKIDEYNLAVAQVNEDTRLRSTILKEEEYDFATGKWRGAD